MKPLNQKAERVQQAAAEDRMDEVRAMQTVTAGCATTFDPGWDSLLRFLETHGTPEALAEARRAADAADDDPRHRPYYWARVLVEEGREEAAREELRRALAADPGFEPARELAEALGMEGGEE